MRGLPTGTGRWAAMLVWAGLAGGGCAQLGFHDGPTVKFSQGSWDAYQSYLEQLGDNGKGFFAISSDGQSWGRSVCTTDPCAAPTDVTGKVVRACETSGAGGHVCQIFAIDRDEQLNYDEP